MSVGASLRRIRTDQGLTQKEVGLRAGLPTSYVSRIENDRVQPTMATLGRVAAALDVEVADVFRADGEAPVPGHRCPVSSSGQCIGRLIREQEEAAGPAGARSSYDEEELGLLRITDYLVRHGSATLRTTLRTLLEALMNQVEKRPGRPCGRS